MKKIVVTIAFVATVALSLNAASTHLSLDNRTETRDANATERIFFSPTWETEAAGATARVSIDGVAVTDATEAGTIYWTPTQGGTYLFTHAVFVNGVQVGKTLSATFVVPEFGFEYIEQTGRAYVTSYSGTAERVEIPSVVYVDAHGRQVADEASAAKTYQVVGIRSSAFARNTTMKAVVFPATVQKIGSEAFSGCESLEQVTIPETVTYIGESAFAWCPKLKRAEVLGALELSAKCFANDSALETVTIGDKVTSLWRGYKDSDGAFGSPFCGCEKLRAVSIGSGITYIEPHVFNGLKSLETIRFGAVIRGVYHHAFSGCESLKTIDGTLWPSVVGDEAFSGVPAYFGAQFDDCTAIGTAAFWNCKGFGGSGERHTLDLPKITSICDGAFEGCVNMFAVQLGAQLETIGANAFKDSGVQIVCFDGPPPSVGEGAFALPGEPRGVLRKWDSWQDWQSAIDIKTGMWHGLHFSWDGSLVRYTFKAINDEKGSFDPMKVTAIVNKLVRSADGSETYVELERRRLYFANESCDVRTSFDGDYEVWFVYDDETWTCASDVDRFLAPTPQEPYREKTIFFRMGNPAWTVTVYLYADEKATEPYAKLSLSSSAEDTEQDFPAPGLSPVELSIDVLPQPPWPTPTWLYEFNGWRRRHYNVQSGKWETGDPIPATFYLGQNETDQGHSLHLVATWKWDLGGDDDFKTWEEIQTEEYDKVVVKSAKIEDGETSEFSLTVEDEGVFSFLWKTSTESGRRFTSLSAQRKLSRVAVPTWDHAEFLVDGKVIATRDGESQWEKVTVNLSGGSPHTVTWRYAKDAGGSAGEDCVWVSDIQLAAFPELVISEDVLTGFRGTVPEGYELSIPDGVTAVAARAFANCGGLQAVTIPSSVTSIGENAFENCTSLKAVHVSKDGDVDAVMRMFSASGFNVDSVTFDYIGEPIDPEPTVGEPLVTNTITYVGLEGVVNTNMTTFTTNDLPLVLGPVDREGYRFLGWTPNGGVIPAGTVTNVSFTANWEVLKYTIDIDGVVGTDFTYGQEVTAATFTEKIAGDTNLVCVGWVGTGDVPATGVGTQVTFMVTQASSLRWTYETNYWFEATVDGQGSVEVGEDGFAADPAGCWVSAGTNVSVAAVADEHWHFAGWTDAETGAAVAETSGLTFVMNGPMSLVAGFAVDTFTVTFDLGEFGTRTGGGELVQTVVWGEAAAAPELTVPEGHAFVGWDKTFDVVTGDIVVTALYDEIRFAITYTETKGCDNSVNPTDYTTTDERIEFHSLTNPPGWRFLGWEPASIETGSLGAVTVTAKWEHVVYEIDVPGVEGVRFYGDTVTAATFAEETEGDTNLVCIGWTGTGDVPAMGVGTQVTFTVTQASSLRWRYETNYWFEATVDGQGSVEVGEDGFAADPTGCWVPAGTNVSVAAVADEHWHFAGWTDAETGAVVVETPELTFVMDGPLLLVAGFAVDTFKVTFDLGEFGTRTGGGELDQTVVWGEAAEAPMVAAFKNYEFAGWDKPFDRVTGLLTVCAQYEKKYQTVIDSEDVVGAPDVEKKAQTYVAYLYDPDDGALAGTVQVTAGKGKRDNKKTNAFTSKVSVSIQLAGETKKVSISGTYDLLSQEPQTFASKSKPVREVTLRLGANGVTGSFEGYVVGGVPKAAVATDYEGAYNVFADEGQFVVTVAKKGTAKVAGVMADGKSVSVSTSLVKGERNACVPVVLTKYGLAFTLWLEEGTVSVKGLSNAVVGEAGTLVRNAYFLMDVYELAELIGDDTYEDYFPCDLPVEQNAKGKWVVADGAKAGSVTLNKDGTVNEEKAGVNPSALKLTYTAKKGTFTGSFKAYYVSKGKPKAISFKVTGILVNGIGYGTATATVNKKKVTLGISIE